MRAISLAGSFLWNASTDGAAAEHPAVIDAAGNVFVGAGNGSVFAFKGSSGALVWQLQVGRSSFSASPVIGIGGDLLFGSSNGSLWALSSADPSLSPSFTSSCTGTGSVTSSPTPPCSPSASSTASNITGPAHSHSGASHSGPLSPGAIAGISMGCGLVAAAAGMTAFFYCRRTGAKDADTAGALSVGLINSDDPFRPPSPILKASEKQTTLSRRASAPTFGMGNLAEKHKPNVFDD